MEMSYSDWETKVENALKEGSVSDIVMLRDQLVEAKLEEGIPFTHAMIDARSDIIYIAIELSGKSLEEILCRSVWEARNDLQ